MKRFRKNTTTTHLTVLHMVSRMINCTSATLSIAMDKEGSERNYRGYLNDLVIEGYLYKKSIIDSTLESTGGRKIGTLFALTKSGAEVLSEMIELPKNGIYFYKEGIRAKSPFGFTHRALLIEVIAEFFRLEKQGKIEILDLIPEFQKEGASRLGTSKATSKVAVENGFVVPDALIRLRIGEKVRVIALELHRTTSTTHINEQLVKHAEAMKKGLFSEYFEEDSTSFLCSIHARETTLKNTIKLIREGKFPNFDTYSNGYHFTTVSDIRENGITNAFFHANGEKSRLFNI